MFQPGFLSSILNPNLRTNFRLSSFRLYIQTKKPCIVSGESISVNLHIVTGIFVCRLITISFYCFNVFIPVYISTNKWRSSYKALQFDKNICTGCIWKYGHEQRHIRCCSCEYCKQGITLHKMITIVSMFCEIVRLLAFNYTDSMQMMLCGM